MNISAKDIELYIPVYPSITNKHLSYNLAKKKEFYDLKLAAVEQKPKETGDLLSNQLLLKRLFSPNTPYKKVIIFHGMGVGKTCSISAIIENFISTEVGDLPRNPAIILVKNEDLVRNYIKEISEVCTKDQYLPQATQKELLKGVSMTEMAKTRRLNDLISKSYEISTYGEFLKGISEKENHQIKREFSNRIIVIDESHHFRSSNTKDNLYSKLYRFLHVVENCRILLASGTPVKDQAHEIASQLNLLLPEDQALPTGLKFDKKFFDKDDNLINENELKDKMKGLISYLRPIMTTAQRIEEGVTYPWTKHIKVYPDGMSQFQSSYAANARTQIVINKTKISGKEVERNIEGGTIYNVAINASTFVFPKFDEDGTVNGGEYGQEAFTKYCVKKVIKTTTVVNKKTNISEKIRQEINNYGITDKYLINEIKNNLAEYSSNFASVIDQIIKHPKEVVFVFIEAVTGAGAILFGLCLQIMGYMWIKSSDDIKKKGHARRFAVITSDPQTINNSKDIQKLLKIANSEANAYGDHLQVIIGSTIIEEGISIKTARQIHIMKSSWNIASLDQATFRVFRFGSLEFLPQKERYIKIFRHIAVEQSDTDEFAKGQGFPQDKGFSKNETIDVYIYRIAEAKDYKTSQIYRIAKEVAIDCPLTYQRNVLKTDIDGTRDCNYTKCNYRCDGFPPTSTKEKVWEYNIPEEDLDYSTYRLYYSYPQIDKLIKDIIELFHNYFALHITYAMKLLDIEENDKWMFLNALDIIINSRLLIRNRYGILSYLKEQGNNIFLDNNINAISNYSSNTYVTNPLITEYSSMTDLLLIMDMKDDQDNVIIFCKKPSLQVYENLSFVTKILLFEYLYTLKNTTNKNTQKVKDIVNQIYGDKIYKTSDGTFVHMLYMEEYKGTSYDVAAKTIKATGKMRYYNTDNKKWENIGSLELEEQYIKDILPQMEQIKEIGFEDNPYGIYGWISHRDNKFRLVLKSDEGEKYNRRGRVCKTFEIHEFIDIYINRLKELPPENPNYSEMSKEEVIKAIKGLPINSQYKKNINDKSSKELRQLLTLLSMKIPEFCKSLKSWFKKHNLLFKR